MWFPAMKLQLSGGEIRLGGLNEEDHAKILASAFTPTVTRWLLMQIQPSLEEEIDFIRKTADSHNPNVYAGVFWNGELVGGMGLRLKAGKHGTIAEGGKFLFKPAVWGKGISTIISQVRLVYAFNATPATQIQTVVALPNIGSWWSLVKAGYRLTGVQWADFQDPFTGIYVPMLRLAAYRPEIWEQFTDPVLSEAQLAKLMQFLRTFPEMDQERLERVPVMLEEANTPVLSSRMGEWLTEWRTQIRYQ